MSHKRMIAQDRKEEVMAAALRLAEQHGYQRITREQIAEAAGVRGPLLHYYFGTMTQFRRELMRRAVLLGNLKVIAQGLAVDDPQAVKADPMVRLAALESLH